MFEYVFGVLVGAVTTYICFKWQLQQFDQILSDINKKLDAQEGRWFVVKKRLHKKIADKLRHSNRHELKRMVETVLITVVKTEKIYIQRLEEKDARVNQLENQVEYLISELPFWKREKVRRELLGEGQ